MYRIIILIVCSCLVLRSQTDSLKGPFIKLKSGELIHGNTIKYTSDEPVSGTISLDGKEYPAKKIEFFMNNKNTLFGGPNVLRSFNYNKNGIYILHYFIHRSSSSSPVGVMQEYYFFSKGLEKVKKFNATNLKDLMKDDPVADRLIKKANQSKKICNGCLIGCAGILAAVFITNGNNNLETGLSGVGGAALISAGIFNQMKRKNTQRAVKQYFGFEMDGYDGFN